MRLSDYVSAQDVDRAIAVTIDSFVARQEDGKWEKFGAWE